MTHPGSAHRVVHSRARARKKLRRAYLFQNAFVILVALLFIIIGFSYVTTGENVPSALGETAYDWYYSVLFLVGGLLALVGLLSLRIGIEAAGHCILFPGCVMNALLAAEKLGIVHRTTLLALIFAAATALRAWGLLAGWRDEKNSNDC